MKKLIPVLIMILTLYSCNEKEQKVNKKTSYNSIGNIEQSYKLNELSVMMNDLGYLCDVDLNHDYLTIMDNEDSTVYNCFQVIPSVEVDSSYISSRVNDYYRQSCANTIRENGVFHYNFVLGEHHFISKNCSRCSDSFGDIKTDKCHRFKVDIGHVIKKLNGDFLTW